MRHPAVAMLMYVACGCTLTAAAQTEPHHETYSESLVGHHLPKWATNVCFMEHVSDERRGHIYGVAGAQKLATALLKFLGRR
jgi:hypothetical protein